MVYNAMPPLNLKHCEDIKTTNTTTIPFIIIIEIPKQKKKRNVAPISNPYKQRNPPKQTI